MAVRCSAQYGLRWYSWLLEAGESRMQWTRRAEIMLAVGFPLLALLAYLLFYALGW